MLGDVLGPWSCRVRGPCWVRWNSRWVRAVPGLVGLVGSVVVLGPLGLALALAFGAERLGHKRLQLNTHSCLQLIVDDADDDRVADLTKLAETRKAGPIPAVGLGSRIRQSEWVPKVPHVALRPCQNGANDTHP